MATTTVERIQTMEEAVELAEEIERANAAVSQMRAQLKAFYEKNGPIETSDKVWGDYPSVKWEFEPDALKNLCTEELVVEGFNPWDYLELPKKSINKLKLEERVLEQFGTKKETNNFSSRKK